MAGNIFGKAFRISTFGESHGKAVGVIVDGCPAGLELSEKDIQLDLDRRRPGQSHITTARNEKDQVEIVSGVFEGKTTGAPIAMIVFSKDQRSQDYEKLKSLFRPGHADFTFNKKYGHQDPRGGGRTSARIMIGRVAGGAIAKKFLKEKLGMEFLAYTHSVGNLSIDNKSSLKDQNQTAIPYYETVDSKQIESNIVRCPDQDTAERMIKLIEEVKASQDSVGGIIQGVIRNVPVGLGEPEFDKLPAELAKAMMSINATKGFEIGSGFAGTRLRGSQHNDEFVPAKEIKVICYDIDGVLSSDFNLYSALENEYNLDRSKVEIVFDRFWNSEFQTLILGKGDINAQIRPYLNEIGWKQSPEKFIELWHKVENKLIWEMVKEVIKYKQKGYTICATTQQDITRAKYLKEVQFLGLFDHWFVTCNIKHKKTENKFWEKLLQTLRKDLKNLEYENILYIDDSKANTVTASGLGINVIHHTDNLKTINLTKKIIQQKSKIKTKTNNAGGVLGGISNGQTIHFRVAIKPVATIGKKQNTVDKNGNLIEVEGKGRHDPCVLPRAVPIVEAMSALTIMDLYLYSYQLPNTEA